MNRSKQPVEVQRVVSPKTRDACEARVHDGEHISLCPPWLLELDNLPVGRRSLPGLNIAEYPLAGPAALQPAIKVALPITFTPYASTQPCSARCVFCSENLRAQGTGKHSSQLRPEADYLARLNVALQAISAVPLGLSLSGLEMTDRPAWFLQLLDVLTKHERAEQAFREKVLYSNGAGFGEPTTCRVLTGALEDFGLERIEWSRHSHLQAQNDRIMRFRPDARIAQNACFQQAIVEVASRCDVVLVCLVQRGGVSSIADIREYLAWADRLGVRSVVFREFARIGDNYLLNSTLHVLNESRVSVESLVRELLNDEARYADEFTPQAITEGYYYWNIEFRRHERMRVVFEASDYRRMHALHASDTTYKLVFHANGHLTADWDPNTRVLLRA